MRISKKLRFALLVSLISFGASAQIYSSYQDASVVFKSDTSTKSALLSNVLKNQAGDLSPVLGAAAWYDLNRNLECRSLLYFDYGAMKKLPPDFIVQAELILKPYDPLTGQQDMTLHPALPEFYVKRVAEPWVDSLVTWEDQPSAIDNGSPARSAWKRKKDPEVRVDVTNIFKEMLREGNNGFMLSLKDSVPNAYNSKLNWFASARNENEHLRPSLFVRLSIPGFAIAANNPIPANLYELANQAPRAALLDHQMLTTPRQYTPANVQQQPIVVPVVANDSPKSMGQGNNNKQ